MLTDRKNHLYRRIDDHILGETSVEFSFEFLRSFPSVIGGFGADDNGVLTIDRYDISTNQWSTFTSIPGAASGIWPFSIGLLDRLIYVSISNSTNTFVITQQGYFFDLDSQQWRAAPVIHGEAQHCPTVQLRFDRDALAKLAADNNSIP